MADDSTSPTPQDPIDPTTEAAAATPADAVPADAAAVDAVAGAGGAEMLPGDLMAASADAAEQGGEGAESLGDGSDLIADQAAIDELLRQASFEDPTALTGAAGLQAQGDAGAPPPGEPFPLPNFSQVMHDAQVSSIDLLRDVELNVKIELGRARMLVEDVLKLGEGSVVELDKLAGDPVDVFVNDRLVARGEVLVLNDNFCVRVNEIVSSTRDET
jgi:flagellar motor switch protein FliN/FliY